MDYDRERKKDNKTDKKREEREREYKLESIKAKIYCQMLSSVEYIQDYYLPHL